MALPWIDLAARIGHPALARMPIVHRLLLENVLRNAGPAEAAAALVDWPDRRTSTVEIPFSPARVLMHDTTCGPALVDIAAMRDAVARAGGDPAMLNPDRPVATSTDHSVAIDAFARPDALAVNMAREMERNGERYRFMKWAAGTLTGFRVFPPGSGIMHTINMELLSDVVGIAAADGEDWLIPDTLIGTDSHTPMINALGVLGWGVGGIEAEGVMFGVPLSLRIPDVIGVRLTGALRPGVTATDLALVVTQRLRALGVSGEFVEFFGPGMATLTAGQRSAVANMAPEYGATTGFFPIDANTLSYLRLTGRSDAAVARVEGYARHQSLWFDPAAEPAYTHIVTIDLAAIGVSLAGPRRPQDLLSAAEVPAALAPGSAVGDVPDRAVAIAAITSCTNTTDTGLLVLAGLVARNARRLGLRPPPWVKTSLAPGSPAAGRRLARAGLLDDLEAIGFGIAAYGCSTCIGNSGALAPVMATAKAEGAEAIAVISGNRNFPGRINASVQQGLLASPPIVIAFALAGRADIDVERDVLAVAPDGRSVRLADLWPDVAEVAAAGTAAMVHDDVDAAYGEATRSPTWAALEAPAGPLYPWDPASTYLRPPPFVRVTPERRFADRIEARPLLVLGDDVTTDHISPAGAIPRDGDAGRWLIERGDDSRDLNVFAARRGNWEVMLRGLFTNPALANRLGGEWRGGLTPGPDGTVKPVWRVAAACRTAGIATVIVAGERYGTGSSRDWAAKGVALLGVSAVLANSFERIHRSNLIGMGVLPVLLPEGWRPHDLGIAPEDRLVVGLTGPLAPRLAVRIALHRATGDIAAGIGRVAVETSGETALLLAGGMIPAILQRTLAATR